MSNKNEAERSPPTTASWARTSQERESLRQIAALLQRTKPSDLMTSDPYGYPVFSPGSLLPVFTLSSLASFFSSINAKGSKPALSRWTTEIHDENRRIIIRSINPIRVSALSLFRKSAEGFALLTYDPRFSPLAGSSFLSDIALPAGKEEGPSLSKREGKAKYQTVPLAPLMIIKQDTLDKARGLKKIVCPPPPLKLSLTASRSPLISFKLRMFGSSSSLHGLRAVSLARNAFVLRVNRKLKDGPLVRVMADELIPGDQIVSMGGTPCLRWFTKLNSDNKEESKAFSVTGIRPELATVVSIEDCELSPVQLLFDRPAYTTVSGIMSTVPDGAGQAP